MPSPFRYANLGEFGKVGLYNSTWRIRVRVEDYSEKWRANGFSVERGWAAPPLLDSTNRIIKIWNMGIRSEEIQIALVYQTWGDIANFLSRKFGQIRGNRFR